MKKTTFLILGVMLIFIGCKSKSSMLPTERLQGDWEIVKANGEMDDLNVGTLYSFHENKMKTAKSGFEMEGPFTATDSTITWNLEDMEMNYTYYFEGDNLIINLSGGQEFTLEEK